MLQRNTAPTLCVNRKCLAAFIRSPTTEFNTRKQGGQGGVVRGGGGAGTPTQSATYCHSAQREYPSFSACPRGDHSSQVQLPSYPAPCPLPQTITQSPIAASAHSLTTTTTTTRGMGPLTGGGGAPDFTCRI